MKEIKITQGDQNQRLDKFLMKYFNKAPKSFVYKMLRKKRIKYNLKKAEGNEMLQTGDTLQLYLAEETMDGFMEEKTVEEVKITFETVYEDENVLFANKPIGLLTHGENAEDKNTLIDQVLYYLSQKGEYVTSKESTFTPATCNRLDRNTGGIVMIGKNLASLQELNTIVAERSVDKLYLTVVKGAVKKPGEAIGYIAKDSDKNQVRVSDIEFEGSKKIITRYKPVVTKEKYTLLEIDLVTGKSHQIRAQLAHIGHPVVGDRKYGDENINKIFKSEFGLNNQYLFAYKLCWNKKEGCLGYMFNKTFQADLPGIYKNINEKLFNYIS